MKKLLLIALLTGSILIVSIVYSQALHSTGTTYQYCEFVWTDNWGTFNQPKHGVIYFGTGKEESYNKSLYSGLNYLGSKGWELCTAYVEEAQESTSYTYTFKKKL